MGAVREVWGAIGTQHELEKQPASHTLPAIVTWGQGPGIVPRGLSHTATWTEIVKGRMGEKRG